MRRHSKIKVEAYCRLLVKCNAPDKLVSDFREVVEIDNGISEGERDLESLDRLLLDVCRRYGFAAPFSSPARRAWLRPSTIDDEHPDHHDDCGDDISAFNPIAEQSYRRGYVQGFCAARSMVANGQAKQLESRENELFRWRRAVVYFGPSAPGTTEAWGIRVSVRSGLSAKLRFDILERDRRKCVVCGRGAADGVVLHIDHIVAISNGGGNEPTNLQTLCEECNLGKGAR
jgi:5-methylcytosine-specific restriction endonuclease McrA